MSKWMKISAVIAISWSLFHLYTAMFGSLPAMLQRPLHVSFALSLGFSLFPISRKKTHPLWSWLDGLTIGLPLLIGGYVMAHAERLTTRVWFVDPVQGWDLWLGILFLLLVLEMSRRVAGKAMTLLGSLFIVYGFIGDAFSGLLQHRGLDVQHLVDLMFLSPEGIFGIPVGVAADYVFYFILFGAFLKVSGGGQLFNDLAFRLTRRSVGGPAKASVLSSGWMGSISGSAVANVASTGIFTIPLMKRSGYSAKDAAAIEALSSTGGQLMPPIMGAAVFIMAEMVGVPYLEIMLAAVIPALLYYLSLICIVHLKAMKEKFAGSNNDGHITTEKQEKIWQRIHLLLPLAILVGMIFLGYSLQNAALWAIVSIIACSYVRRATFLSVKNVFEAMENGAKQAVQVTIPCAVAGIIVGMVSFSGLGLKLTSIMAQWSFGYLLLLMVLVAVACIILGMGMPTTSAYIMAAVLLAPALQEFGIAPLAAHLFVFYYAVLSMITPPVALAAYSAAGISGSGLNETGIRALQMSLAAFIIPFAFVFHPPLLMEGSALDIMWGTLMAALGVCVLAVGVVGYWGTSMSRAVRVISLLSAILLIGPVWWSELTGIALLIFIWRWQRKKKMNDNMLK